MLGVLVNTAAVLLGGLLGLVLKKGIPERISSAIMSAVALCIISIGITGMLKGENSLTLIASMAAGTAIGTLLNLEGAVERLGQSVERRLRHEGEKGGLAQGFVTASLLFCVGAMAVVGSIDAGLRAENDMLFSKSLLDMISACMLSMTLGVGVLLSAGAIFVYQGAIVLLAQLIAPLLSETDIAELACAGSVMLLALGLNMLGLTKLKVANFLPALLLAPLFSRLFAAL